MRIRSQRHATPTAPVVTIVVAAAAVAALGTFVAPAGAASSNRNARAAKKTTRQKSTTRPTVAVPTTVASPGIYVPARTYPVAEVTARIQTRPGRTINVMIRHPRGATGALPLVVFSHGGEGRADGHRDYAEWGKTFARAGYVTVSPAHAPLGPGQGIVQCAALRIPADECESSDFGTDTAAGQTLPAILYERPRDVSAVLDNLALVERTAGVRIDRDRMGAAGHSAGAWTTLRVAGTTVQFSPSVGGVTARDDRFKAFVAASPHGVGYLGLTPTSWDGVDRPLVTFTGPSDSTPGEPAPGRLDTWRYVPSGEKYLEYLDDRRAIHMTFGLGDRDTRDLQPFVGLAAVAFFDAKLLGRPEAQAWIDGDGLTTWSGGRATWQRK